MLLAIGDLLEELLVRLRTGSGRRRSRRIRAPTAPGDGWRVRWRRDGRELRRRRGRRASRRSFVRPRPISRRPPHAGTREGLAPAAAALAPRPVGWASLSFATYDSPRSPRATVISCPRDPAEFDTPARPHRSRPHGRKATGSLGTPCTRTSKWRWGPVLRPVLPISPISSPWSIRSPTDERMTLMWA